MNRRDVIVIPLAAVAVMAINVAISFGVVWLYSSFYDPGHPAAHYEAAAMRIAPVSSVIAGIPLMFAAGFLIARSRPERRGLAAAGAVALFYILLDTAILLSAGAAGGMWTWAALSHASKLLAALAGGRLGMMYSRGALTGQPRSA